MTTNQACRKLGVYKSRLYRLMDKAGIHPWQRIERGHVVNSFSDGDIMVLRRYMSSRKRLVVTAS